MSQLVGLISRNGEEATGRLLELLSSPISYDAYGIATAEGAEHSPQPIDFTTLTGSATIGYRLVKVLPTDNPQPVHDASKAIAFVGRLGDEPCELRAIDAIRNGAEEGLRKLLVETEGFWAAAVVDDDKILCARDPIGAVPLYYGQTPSLVGVSQDTKTLRRLGMEPQRVKPGHIVTLSAEGIHDEEVAPLEEPAPTFLSLGDAADELDRLMIESVSSATWGLSSPTLAFSGGIDSALVAYYMELAGSRPRLICVGAPDSTDPEAAERAADALGLPLRIKTFTDKDVDESLGAILSSVEEADPMKVGVALPLYFAAWEASESPCRAILTGNGSDELFGGYAKYADEYQKQGDGVKATMFSDVARSHEVNLERDWKVCSDLGLELRLPFADPEITRFALSLPLRYKLPTSGREPRKIILRHLAKKLGLPDEVAEKPKKAAQYSSGAGKIIEKLAKRQGKTTKGYLVERLSRVMQSE